MTGVQTCALPIWFTTTTNQWRETNSTVDIGPHWMALNAQLNPLDTDADGVHDYLEDRNGNGATDSGETKTTDASDAGLLVRITRPRPGGNLP